MQASKRSHTFGFIHYFARISILPRKNVQSCEHMPSDGLSFPNLGVGLADVCPFILNPDQPYL